MNSFWKNISQLAQGQLFHGGYLSRETVIRLAQEKTCAKANGIDARPMRRPIIWPRLSIPH